MKYLPLALLLLAFVPACTNDDTAAAPPALHAVDCGAPIALQGLTLVGRRDGSSCVYKGVPFAEQPVGALRYKYPQPLAGDHGTVASAGFGPDCLQSATFKDVPVGEACLYLNVWIPGETIDGGRLTAVPVMVFFYGGGFTAGGGSWAFYNGEELTTHGVIVVTVNYRLGPLGYLAPSAVTDSDGTPLIGNLGLRDQIQSLRWVRDHIAALGGDPKRVTIFGESAGAWSVCSVMASTEAVGLFHRAIMESGECTAGSRAHSAFHADQFLADAGCPRTGTAAMACLRNLSPDDYPGYAMGRGMVPVVDGELLPDQPLYRLRDGANAKVPLIAGFNREETDALRLLPDNVQRVNQSFTDFWAAAGQALSGAQIDRARTLYADGYADPMALGTAMLDDLVFACPAHDAAAAHTAAGGKAWHYRFSMGTGENLLEPYVGTPHGLEIPFVFGNTGALAFAYGDDARWRRMHALTEQIQRYWTRFAITGDPNGEGDPAWAAFGGESNRMELTVDLEVTHGTHDARCAFWSEVAPQPTGERFAFIKKLIGYNPIE
jgi:para-nitrobenzyl esterase